MPPALKSSALQTSALNMEAVMPQQKRSVTPPSTPPSTPAGTPLGTPNRAMSFAEFFAALPHGEASPGPTDKSEKAAITAAAIKVERRRKAPACRELEWLMLAPNLLTALFLAIAASGWIAQPLPVAGGKAAAIPAWLWPLGLFLVTGLLLLGRFRHQRHWLCRGARVGSVLWVAMWLAVIMPGVPAMSWVLFPVVIAVHARAYLILCDD